MVFQRCSKSSSPGTVKHLHPTSLFHFCLSTCMLFLYSYIVIKLRGSLFVTWITPLNLAETFDGLLGVRCWDAKWSFQEPCRWFHALFTWFSFWRNERMKFSYFVVLFRLRRRIARFINIIKNKFFNWRFFIRAEIFPILKNS